jgi:MOSC domain-containing protein YiiM
MTPGLWEAVMRIAAVFVGMPRKVRAADRQLVTAGAKSPVDSVFLGVDGFEGDGVANRKYHGGRDRAACLYVAEHYAWWKQAHDFDLLPGAFCENLTVEGASEEAVCIGDIFRAGSALLQVSQPRDPCRTLDQLNGLPGLAELARDSGKCGFHMRTLEEGVVHPGESFELVRRDPRGIAVARVLDLYHGRSTDRELFRRLQEMTEFGVQVKQDIARKMGWG